MKGLTIAITTGLIAICAAVRPLDVYRKLENELNDRVLTRRQQPGRGFSLPGLTQSGSQKAKPAKRVELEPSGKRAGAKRSKVYFGPHTLPKKGVKSPLEFIIQFDPYSKTWSNTVEFPSDITLLFTEHYLEYEDGTRASASNGVYSHHTLFMDTNKGWKSAWTCPGPIGSLYPQITLMGTMNNQGEDNSITTFTSPDGKLNSGFYISKQDLILSTGEVINYSDEERKIYVVADIEYLPGRQPDFYDASMQALFVSGCDWTDIGGAMNLKLPVGSKKHTFKSKDMMFSQDGYIVNLLGHLHDGGINIALRLNNETVCDSKAIYGKSEGHGHSMMGGMGTPKATADGTKPIPDGTIGTGVNYEGIVSMTLCDKPIKVSKGDIYTIEATIDFEQRPARAQVQGAAAEVMGMFSAIFASKQT